MGRIKRSWGTEHKPTIRRLEEMMDGLFATGRLDLLRDIQRGTYTPLQVYSYYRINKLEDLPTAALIAPLEETFEKWLMAKECTTSHRLSLKQSLRHFLAGSRLTSSVADLPSLLTTLRGKLSGKHPRSFNLARSAAQAFVAATMKRTSPLYNAIKEVPPLKVTPQRTKHPVTPMELTTIAATMPYNHQMIAWGMATTGMGPAEFWGKWDMNCNVIEIHGTKRKARERIVPLLMPIYRPAVLYPAFRRSLAEHSDLKPYDLRRTYANWLEAAGIPRSRAKQYMGHGASDVTDLYEWHEVSRHINEDAARLKKYLSGATEKRKLKLERKG